MNGTRKRLKKAIAAAAASAMLLSGSSSVFAAAYQDAEKAALSQFVKDFSAYWDTVMAEQQKAMQGSNAVMTLTLEDGGKALLSAASGGMDFSWLNTLSMNMTASVSEGKETANAAILLNDSPLCNMNVYMDMANLTEYFQVPELSDIWMKLSLLASLEMSEEELAQSFETEDEAQAYLNYMEEYKKSMSNMYSMLGDFATVLPDTGTLSTLAERYGNIVITHTQEGTSAEEELSVEGVSEACTVHETTVTEADFLAMMNELLTTAKEDQELKGLLDKWSEVGGQDLNAQLQAGADSLLSEISQGTGSEEALISSKIWTDKEGEISGREIRMIDETGNAPVFTWKNPSAEGNSALLIEFGVEGETLTFIGTGQSAEGLLNGEYVVAVGGVKMLGVKTENLETNPEVPGYYNGKIHISVLDTGTEEEPNPLAAFGITVSLASDAKAGTNQIGLSITNSGVPLVTLSVSGGYAETGASAPEQAALDSALDLTAQDAETAYIQSMDWSAILENAAAAGVPEELVGALDQMIQQSVDAVLNPPQEAAPEGETAETAVSEEAA